MNFFSASSSPIRLRSETDERVQSRPNGESTSPRPTSSFKDNCTKTPRQLERNNLRRHSVGDPSSHSSHESRLFNMPQSSQEQEKYKSTTRIDRNLANEVIHQHRRFEQPPSASIHLDNHLEQEQHQQYTSVKWPLQRPQGPWKVPLNHPKRLRSLSLGPTNGAMSVRFNIKEYDHDHTRDTPEKMQRCTTNNKGPSMSSSLPTFSKLPPLAKSSLLRSKSFGSRQGSCNSQNRNTPFPISSASQNDSAPNSPRIIQRSGSKAVKHDLKYLEQILTTAEPGNVDSLSPVVDALHRLLKVSSDAYYQVVMRKCRGETIVTQLMLRFPDLETPCQALLQAISKTPPIEPIKRDQQVGSSQHGETIATDTPDGLAFLVGL